MWVKIRLSFRSSVSGGYTYEHHVFLLHDVTRSRDRKAKIHDKLILPPSRRHARPAGRLTTKGF